jgi:hypothetical protein
MRLGATPVHVGATWNVVAAARELRTCAKFFARLLVDDSLVFNEWSLLYKFVAL